MREPMTSPLPSRDAQVIRRAAVAPIPRSARMALVLAAALQGPLLAYLLAATWPGWLALTAVSTLAAAFVGRRLDAPRSYASSCTVAMLALGNVGMLVGWMADFGFGPLIRADVCLCGCWGSALGQGLIAGPSWMQAGMLIACVPSLCWIRPTPAFLDAATKRRWHWAAHVVLSPVGMLLGMLAAAGAFAAVPVQSPALHLIATFLLMSAGMALGMGSVCYGLDWLEART